MSWSPCRLKVEELEGERSRLEQEKQMLEMQMEKLTLQVGLMAREMFPAQTVLLPAPVNETWTSSYAFPLSWLRATAGFCRTTGLSHSGSLCRDHFIPLVLVLLSTDLSLFSLVLSPVTPISLWS